MTEEERMAHEQAIEIYDCGVNDTREQIAKNMYALGITKDLIKASTGLSFFHLKSLLGNESSESLKKVKSNDYFPPVTLPILATGRKTWQYHRLKSFTRSNF